jgi:hypothetical protein
MPSRRRSEEKADLAVQDTNKCAKCFETLPPGVVVCPECGAPVTEASAGDAEATVYPELARANLARMRGDYKQAEEQLLAVLRRFPNNPSANEMLGDLAAEREDYPHAVEWYEMALDIVPNSASIARKVREARSHLDRKAAQDTTAQLGLPDPSSRMPLIIGSCIVLLIAAVVGGYLLGAKGSGPSRPKLVSTNVINATAPDQGATPDKTEPKADGATDASEDDAILQAIRGKAEDAAAIRSAVHDPRAGSLTISFEMAAKDHRQLAARIARDTFAVMPGYKTLTLRGLAGGKVAYMADASSDRVAETQTPDWKQQHQNDPDSWVGYVLQNEWPTTAAPPADTTPPGGAPPPTAGATAGEGPPGSTTAGQ